MLEVISGWIDETTRALRQAQIRAELREGVDLRRLAVEVHRLLWSCGWSGALYGREASASAILDSIWQRLSEVALDSGTSLPPRAATLPPLPEPPRAARDPRDPNVPTWRVLLTPDDPLYQAFERHEIMGDPHDFLRPPEVLPVDVLESTRYGGPRYYDDPNPGPPPASFYSPTAESSVPAPRVLESAVTPASASVD
jgi:hypothetical protein